MMSAPSFDTWRCQSPRCAHVFLVVKQFGEVYKCPKCQQPAIMVKSGKSYVTNGKSKQTDKLLQGVADRHNLTDMGQRGGTRAGESVKQIKPQAQTNQPGYQFAGGFSAPFNGDAVSSSWSKAPEKLAAKFDNSTSNSYRPAAKKPIPTQVVAKDD